MVSNIFKTKRKKSESEATPARSRKQSDFIPQSKPKSESESDRPHSRGRKTFRKGGGRSSGPGSRRSRNGKRSRSGGNRDYTPTDRRVLTFDPARYADSPQPKGAFTQLLEPIRNAIIVQGYVTPTPVQEQAIPAILNGNDVLGSAQTGTGKTAAFVLPLLDLIYGGTHRERELGVPSRYERPQPNRPKALILAPTRELADQIGKSIEGYAAFLKVSHTVVYGGVGQYPQVRELEEGVDILVATPGRLLDLMRQGHIDLNMVEYFVLDEVDRMLDMGFIPDIRKIMEDIPSDRQTLFFSATLSRKVLEIAGTMVHNPSEIVIEPEQMTIEKVRQLVYFVDGKNKKDLLSHILRDSNGGKAIVFTQMKHAANTLAESLEKSGIRATAIHGNKSQSARTKALAGFKGGHFQVMVATDVAARGIDVNDVTHVINYDMPMDAETYVHRIGRTARAGADGDAISFCSAPERALLHYVEQHLKSEVPVERNHEFHCETAANSRMAAPKLGGRKGGGGGGGRGRGGNRNSRPRTNRRHR